MNRNKKIFLFLECEEYFSSYSFHQTFENNGKNSDFFPSRRTSTAFIQFCAVLRGISMQNRKLHSYFAYMLSSNRPIEYEVHLTISSIL